MKWETACHPLLQGCWHEMHYANHDYSAHKQTLLWLLFHISYQVFDCSELPTVCLTVFHTRGLKPLDSAFATEVAKLCGNRHNGTYVLSFRLIDFVPGTVE
jgi:hypothetical protein